MISTVTSCSYSHSAVAHGVLGSIPKHRDLKSREPRSILSQSTLHLLSYLCNFAEVKFTALLLLVNVVHCDWQEELFMLEACDSYPSPLRAYITTECCLQTTLTTFICCVNPHHYLPLEVTELCFFFYFFFNRERLKLSSIMKNNQHSDIQSCLKIMWWFCSVCALDESASSFAAS